MLLLSICVCVFDSITWILALHVIPIGAVMRRDSEYRLYLHFFPQVKGTA